MEQHSDPNSAVAPSISLPVHRQKIPLAIYVQHRDLVEQRGRNTGLTLCNAIDRIRPDSTLGSQFYNGVWSIWLKSQDAYSDLSKVKQFELDGITISLHDGYPIFRHLPNEKVLFKDLPFWVNNDDIIDYLNNQPGIEVKSAVHYATFRDHQNKLTPYLSGDRFVYIKGNIPQALPDRIILDYNTCRVSHKTQELVCARCRKHGHSHRNTDMCPAYIEKDDNVITIRSPKYVLCNYYPCNLKFYGKEFTSLEQAYQWRFVTYVGIPDLAEEILRSTTPQQAKEIARRVPRHLHQEWHSIKLTVMRDILHAKADYCEKFKKTLIETAGKSIVESTSDVYWSSGIPPHDSMTTLPSYYPGKNMLGRLMEQVRADLIKEAELAATLLDVNSPIAGQPDNQAIVTTSTNSDDTQTPQIENQTTTQQIVTETPPNDITLNRERTTSTSSSISSNSSTTSSQATTSSTGAIDNSDMDIDINQTDSDVSVTSGHDSDDNGSISGVEELAASPVTSAPDNDNIVICTDTVQNTAGDATEIPTPQLNPKPLPRRRVSRPAVKNRTDPPQECRLLQMFDKMKKRKITPNKEADTTRDSIKIQRGDSNGCT